MRIIAFCNQKGGVGKTTSALNVAACLAQKGYKTLLVDMDPQGNAGSGLGINKYRVEKSVYHAIIGETALTNVIRKTDYENLYIVPANRDLIGAEVELVQVLARETKLKTALQSVQTAFDYCIIDCPPSLNLLSINALTAANDVIIPVQTEYYALEGISELVNTLELVQNSINPNLQILGIILTMYDSRNNLANQVVDEVKSYFKEKVFQTIVPRNVKLSESPSHGQPIYIYDPKSKGAEAYQDLVDEIDQRVQGTAKGNLRLVQN
jgi:chromosome partitioning protein